MSSCHLGFTRFPLWAAALNFCVFGITFLSQDEWSVKSNLRITGPQINNFNGCNYANHRFFPDLCPLGPADGVLPPWQIPFCFRASPGPLTVGKLAVNCWAAHLFDRQLDLACFLFFSSLPSLPFVGVAVRAASSLFAGISPFLSITWISIRVVNQRRTFALLISWSKGLTTCAFSHTPVHMLVRSFFFNSLAHFAEIADRCIQCHWLQLGFSRCLCCLHHVRLNISDSSPGCFIFITSVLYSYLLVIQTVAICRLCFAEASSAVSAWYPGLFYAVSSHN